MNLGQNAKSKSQSHGYDQSLQDIIQKHKNRNLNIQVIYLNSFKHFFFNYKVVTESFKSGIRLSFLNLAV